MAENNNKTRFFNVLKRFFSNKVIIKKIDDDKFKTIDINNTQLYGSLANNYFNYYNYSPHQSYQYTSNFNIFANLATRNVLFREYEMMDQDPIIASALDLYSEETIIKNEFGQILTIKSDDHKIKDILDNLFYDILNIDFNLFHWVRNLIKYGDFFLKLNLMEKVGIVNVIPLSPYSVERIEYYNYHNLDDVKFKVDGPIIQGTFENYEISHFRMLTDSNFLPYGKSMIENARRVWKQLTLMEDAMLIHRIMRAPQKRIFEINVGNLPPNEVPAYIEMVSNKIKKVPYIDESTGDYNLRYNMQNLLEDFFIPTRGGESSTKIETLQGLEYNAIEDIEYLRNKMLAALRIPKAFLGYDETINAKATLSQEDIRFARTIERIQKIVVSELENIARIHLFINGFNENDLFNFELKFSSPSIIFEQEKLEMMDKRLEIASKAREKNFFSDDFIYKNIWNMSEEEYIKIREQLIFDIKFNFRLEKIKSEGIDIVEEMQKERLNKTLEDFKKHNEQLMQNVENNIGNNQENNQENNKENDNQSAVEENKNLLSNLDVFGKNDIKENKNKKYNDYKNKIKKLAKRFNINYDENGDFLNKKLTEII